ncbi:uncharacterized protein LOC111328562 [Stylophora pistillata]|uniref:uncharacterized protein LOC111328562 n=1 Tax=Stylophora pistillata TaxID=50429 RepID=UPI000C049EFB|nr:uncharacterized protein LOC111328562 [Stylophora pistillata]
MVSDDILLCADDGHRAIYQSQLERDGVTIKGKSRKLVRYPEGAYRLESITVSNAPRVYFTAAKSGQCSGGLYCFSMETGEVMTILENMTNSCKEVKKVAKFNDTLVFTDIEARQVKRYNPLTKKVDILAGDGREGEQDGNEKSCSFVQVHGICRVADTLFTTDAAPGKIKLITGLSGTTNFLSHLGNLYDSFGIGCKGSTSQTITPEECPKQECHSRTCSL